MLYDPYRTTAHIVFDPDNGTYHVGIQVPIQWENRGFHLLPIVLPADVQLEIMTASGPVIMIQDQFRRLLADVLPICNEFESKARYPCHPTVIVAGELVTEHTKPSEKLFDSNGLAFKLTSLSIDVSGCILSRGYHSKYHPDMPELLHASSERVKQIILSLIS